MKVHRLSIKQIDWNKADVRKSKSPCVWIKIITIQTIAISDEGSEINCIDQSLAIRNKIDFIPTICTAYAAGSTSIRLEGETKHAITARVIGNARISLTMGRRVVDRNLCVDVFIGKPGKKDNLIVTYPHKN